MPAEIHTSKDVHTPLGEDGKGLYSAGTLGQFEVLSNITDALMEALEVVTSADSFKNDPYLSICDFGTADAGTSLPVLNKIVDRAKEKDPEKDVMIQYEDQPTNEWRSVFAHVTGKNPVMGVKRTYLQAFPTGVYVSAVGRSFYDQCLPAKSLHMGFASTAMHWLSAHPGTFPDGAMHHTQVTAGDPSLLPFFKQAAADWEKILLARAPELKPGGRLLIQNFCVDESGQSLGKTNTIQKVLYDEKLKCWTAMASEGLITQEELARTAFPNYYRTVEEHCAPLKDETSPVFKAGLRLVSCHTKVTGCYFRAQRLADPDYKAKSAIEYGRDAAVGARTWSNATDRKSVV